MRIKALCMSVTAYGQHGDAARVCMHVSFEEQAPGQAVQKQTTTKRGKDEYLSHSSITMLVLRELPFAAKGV